MKLSQLLRSLSPEGQPARLAYELWWEGQRLRPGAEPLPSDPALGVVRYDSRAILAGDIFVALKGARTDGHDLLHAALAQGASLVVGSDPEKLAALRTKPGFVLHVKDTRQALAQLSSLRLGNPASHLVMVGVTGTNGKTTTTYLVEGILRSLGQNPGVIGTVEYRLGERNWHSDFTTPEAPSLQTMLARMRDLGASHVVMEVSSHGLAMQRVGAISYQAAAFTNLTQDHLDFHGSMQDYFAAKAKLFSSEYLPGGAAVLNWDDPKGRELAEEIAQRPEPRPRVIRFSLDPASEDADLRPIEAPSFLLSGISCRLRTPEGEVFLQSPLVGPHNLANLLTAFGLALGLGYPAAPIAEALSRSKGAPGRLERVTSPRGFDAFVDYAHSPDALERVLVAMRPLTPGRLIAVFGCGGDRDRSKRPLMGEVVGRLADLAIVTSDNPRTEDPMSIIDMIVPGVLQGGMTPEATQKGFWIDPDRRAAIAKAVSLAQPGDAVLLFGKGHEDYQIIGTTKIHFDDRLIFLEVSP
jgi:UDP-N-acetylmuramoyl-L-alanyl-D-glutamate--2,6-diaminopimelate ligase